MSSHKIVALGAGLTGLSFAYHMDENIPVFEKDSKVGGLAQTINIGDYNFDLGPHLLHIRSSIIRKFITSELGVGLKKYKRVAKIYFEKKIIDYPFEMNLHAVSSRVRKECLNGLNSIHERRHSNDTLLRIGSYKDYAVNAYGDGIARNYLLPYNRKIWAIDPSQITCEWMHFLPSADIEKIKKGSERPLSYDFGYNVEFYYPQKCGIQQISNALAANLSSICLDEEAVRLDLINKTIYFSNGRQVRYKSLISTIPLRALIEMTGDLKLVNISKQLTNNRVYIINIVIEGVVPSDVHWIYFPEREFSFYRISLPNSYFRFCAPPKRHIIAAEVSTRNPEMDISRLKNEVIKEIKNLNIFNIKKVILIHIKEIPIAYCIYDKNRTKTVEFLRQHLESHDVITSGRYGMWEYSCMEDAILQGRSLALRMRS
ncbi:protoporphyrinogen/coproporphyrinogen oxidase [Acidobacteriota bacterium]